MQGRKLLVGMICMYWKGNQCEGPIIIKLTNLLSPRLCELHVTEGKDRLQAFTTCKGFGMDICSIAQ